MLPNIAAIDAIGHLLSHGGRLFYFGTGTSGRLGVLDAAECPPTFNTDPDMVQALIAGLPDAMFHAKEGAEDNEAQGAKDVAAHDAIAKECVELVPLDLLPTC